MVNNIVKCFLVGILVFNSACSKKEETKVAPSTPQTVGLAADPYFNFLPENTFGFFGINFESPAYKKLSTNPNFADTQEYFTWVIEKLGNKNTEQLESVKKDLLPILEELKNSEILKDHKKILVFSSLVPGSVVPALGLSYKLTPNSAKLLSSKIKELLVKQKIEVQDYNNNGVKANKIMLGTANPQMPLSELFLVENNDEVLFATNESLLPVLSSKTKTEKLANMIKDLKTTGVMDKVLGRENEYSLAIINLKPLLASGMPAVQEMLNKVPVNSAVFSGQMDQGLKSTIAVALNDSFGLTAVTATRPANIEQFSKESIGFLSINGELLTQIKQAILKNTQVDPAVANPAAKNLALLDTVDSLSLSASKSMNGMLFPELAFLLSSKTDSSTLSATILEQIKSATSTAPMPMGQWQEKEVNGLKTKYLLSPLGLGVYLAEKGKNLLVATTESALSNLSMLDPKQSVMTLIPENAKTGLTNKVNAVVGYINYPKLAEAIKDAQGALAMFSGGNSNIDNTYIDRLSSMGSALFNLQVDKNLLVGETVYF